jgi:hypothetical protein
VSLRRTLDVIGTTVERATSIPLSASCMVNRADMLSLVERARAELPVELDEAAALLVAHQEVITRAEQDAELIVAQARERAAAMVEDSALIASARGRSEQILDAARSEAARLLRQADEYCDGRLAEFENDLDRAMAQVRRGRDRLRERSDLASAEAETGAEAYEGQEYEEAYADGTEDEAYGAQGITYPTYRPVSVAYDQAADGAEEAAAEAGQLVHAQAGAMAERLVVDLAGVERAEAEHSGLGQRVNLQ